METGLSLPKAGPCSQALLWPQHLVLARREHARAEPGLNPGRPEMGGASCRLARLCPPPHPTLPCDRKAEPRFPELPPPLRPLLCRAGGVLASLLVMAAAVAMETGQ